VLRAAFGLELDEQQLQTFAMVAGGRAPPTKRVRELWCMIGRRGAKSKIAAAIAVYQALFVKHKLNKGETSE
jgi:phage terminase large subunit-like protein